MSNWNKVKAFVNKLDFDDVRKDVADDLKKLSLVFGSLGVLSVVPRLPVAFGNLPKAFGIDMAAMQTSLWVSVALFGAFVFTYILQLALRVKARKQEETVVAPVVTQPLVQSQPNNNDTRGYHAAHSGNASISNDAAPHPETPAPNQNQVSR